MYLDGSKDPKIDSSLDRVQLVCGSLREGARDVPAWMP